MVNSRVLFVATLPAHANAHGSMFEPPSRNSYGLSLLSPTCAGGACQWYNQGCSIGCKEPSGNDDGAEPDCENPIEPTLVWGVDTELVEHETDGYGNPTTYFPWRYPGAAPVRDSCGVTGGDMPPLGQDDPPPLGFPAGMRGSSAPPLLDVTEWIAGSEVEVAFALAANHGGGYQYRLCPVGGTLDEACFQKTPLEFVGDKQWIRFTDGERHEIPALRVGGDKVLPENSTWTKNPIPGCKINGGRSHAPCLGPSSTPPLADRMFTYGYPSTEPGIFGYGSGRCMGNKTANPEAACSTDEYRRFSFDFGIVDRVRVPVVPPGKYVVSFRWDCEQTKQIWNSCGDITIKADGGNTEPFSAQRGCSACCGICAGCDACLEDKTSENCARCWDPKYWWNKETSWWTPRASTVACLGGSLQWQPGDELGVWSPDCAECWASDDSCEPHTRPSVGSSSAPIVI